MRHSLQAGEAERQEVVGVSAPDCGGGAVTEGGDDGQREQRLRRDHGGRRKQQAKPTERSRARQQEIKRQPDHDRGQSSSALASKTKTRRPGTR